MNPVLLDTHAFLWFVSGDQRLPVRVREIIEDVSRERYVSIASCWEIAIKYSRGRLELDISIEQLLGRGIEGNDLIPLRIERRHLLEIPALTNAHRDPFDRLLVAQAKVEELTLLSSDQMLDAYGITRIWQTD